MRTPCYSVNRTAFAVLLVPGLYKIHSIIRTLASLSRKIVRHRWLIRQLNIILTLVIIVPSMQSTGHLGGHFSATVQPKLGYSQPRYGVQSPATHQFNVSPQQLRSYLLPSSEYLPGEGKGMHTERFYKWLQWIPMVRADSIEPTHMNRPAELSPATYSVFHC